MTGPACRPRSAPGWGHGANDWTKAYRAPAWAWPSSGIFPSFMGVFSTLDDRPAGGARGPPDPARHPIAGKAALTMPPLMWHRRSGRAAFAYDVPDDKTGLLKAFLGSLPETAARAGQAVEIDRLMDGHELPHDAILDGLRPALRNSRRARRRRCACSASPSRICLFPSRARPSRKPSSRAPAWCRSGTGWAPILLPAETAAYFRDSKALILARQVRRGDGARRHILDPGRHGHARGAGRRSRASRRRKKD